MKFDYDYRVLSSGPDGYSHVEYVNPELGSVTRLVCLPHDRGEGAVRTRVLESFPTEVFYARYLATREYPVHFVTGTMSVDFDDGFYDIMETAVEEDTA